MRDHTLFFANLGLGSTSITEQSLLTSQALCYISLFPKTTCRGSDFVCSRRCDSFELKCISTLDKMKTEGQTHCNLGALNEDRRLDSGISAWQRGVYTTQSASRETGAPNTCSSQVLKCHFRRETTSHILVFYKDTSKMIRVRFMLKGGKPLKRAGNSALWTENSVLRIGNLRDGEK